MNTAQILYEQYKVLPLRVQKELFALINEGRKETIIQKKFEERLEEIKKQPKRPLKDILEDIDIEAEQVMKEKGMTLKDINKAIREMNTNRTEFKRKLRAKNEGGN